jgi:hypothetical protein
MTLLRITSRIKVTNDCSICLYRCSTRLAAVCMMCLSSSVMESSDSVMYVRYTIQDLDHNTTKFITRYAS